MNTLELFKNFRLIALLLAAITIGSCSDDDDVPVEEPDLEVITDVTLVFTNTDDPTDVVMASAQDPDGLGAQELQILGGINLSPNTTYTLTFEIFNNLETPGEDIGEEIEEEDDEHQVFFGFTDGAFSNPMGDGNIGASSAADPVNYMDEDSEAQDGSGNPVGLVTSWTTGDNLMGGAFTVNLQHQPDIKTATTTSEDGDTDFDLTFVLNIQ